MTDTTTGPRRADDGVLVVLLVDDDPQLGQLVAACLGFEGAEVRTARTLADARAQLHPGLGHIVLDRHLPDGDGLELLADIEAACPRVPIVVLTSPDERHDTGLPQVAKSDVAALVDLLGLEPADHRVPDFVEGIDVADGS